MKFSYFLDNSAGWAGIIFEHEKTSLNYSVSGCMGENIRQLLGGILVLTKYRENSRVYYDADNYLNIDENGFTWCIDEEGSRVNFLFSKTDSSRFINLKIEEDDFEEIKIVFNMEINLMELIDQILYSCDTMLKKYGIIGYHLNFWDEFPISNYLMLKDYRNNKIKFDSFNEINNGREENMDRTSIEEEIGYIYGK